LAQGEGIEIRRIKAGIAVLREGWLRLSSLRRAAAIFEAVTSGAGLIWLFVEIVTYLSPDSRASLIRLWLVFLILNIVYTCVRIGVLAWMSAPKRNAKFRVDGTNATLEVLIGDVFEVGGALVIPTSVTFDTNTNDQTIHPQSIQGQFTHRFFSSDNHLDTDLQAKLESCEPVGTVPRDEKPFGKRKEYAVGTCVRLSVPDRTAYFLALTRYNREKTSSATLTDLKTALTKLWSYVRNCGEFEELTIPVIGSGRARVNATHENLAKEIIRSFVAASIEGPFCKCLRVVVYPPDVERGNIDFAKITRFAECQSSNR
jgi:hypothetical protein